jgi:hypothetical protein
MQILGSNITRKATMKAIGGWLSVVAAQAVSALAWFLILGVGGTAMIVAGVCLLFGAGWAFIAGGVFMLLGSAFIRKGMNV